MGEITKKENVKEEKTNNQILETEKEKKVIEENSEKEEDVKNKDKEEVRITEIKKEDEEKEETNKWTKKKKIIITSAIVGVLFFIIILFSTIFALININNYNIIKGVFINGIDVSNLSIEEAKDKFNVNLERVKNKNILLQYNDFETSITLEQIGAIINIDEVIKQAFEIGRDGNIFQNNYEIIKKSLNSTNIEFTTTFNTEEINKIMDNISYSLPGTVVQSSYSIDGENLVITKGKKGIIVDKEQIVTLIDILIKENMKGKEVYEIKIPVIETNPNPIDIDVIHNEIYKEPQNAYIIEEPFQLFVHSNGIDFDVNLAKEMINQEQEQYVIPLIITIPEITVDKLGEEAFPNLLGSYSTNYGASSSNRGINIGIAARTINGKILLPGEIFSYNQLIGDTTPNKGYKLGGSYLNGELVQSYGGGICQVSSTLYNAVVYANLEVVLRYNHSSTVGYVPASRDATVSYGGKDFQFKNSRKYPIKINAVATNGVLKIAIYGIEEEEEYEVVIESKVTGTIPYTTKYIEDNTLPQGEQVVKSNGANGKRSVAYKVLKLNGVVISRTLLSQDTYNPMQRIIRVGTKKESI